MIRVNGDPLDWREGLTVQDVLDQRNFRFPLIIVSVNDDIVPRGAYASAAIPDGADVKVLHLMSGG